MRESTLASATRTARPDTFARCGRPFASRHSCSPPSCRWRAASTDRRGRPRRIRAPNELNRTSPKTSTQRSPPSPNTRPPHLRRRRPTRAPTTPVSARCPSAATPRSRRRAVRPGAPSARWRATAPLPSRSVQTVRAPSTQTRIGSPYSPRRRSVIRASPRPAPLFDARSAFPFAAKRSSTRPAWSSARTRGDRGACDRATTRPERNPTPYGPPRGLRDLITECEGRLHDPERTGRGTPQWSTDMS